MRTTLSKPVNRLDGVVTHELEEGETWAQHGADQPNPVWTHDESWWRDCPLCTGIFTRR